MRILTVDEIAKKLSVAADFSPDSKLGHGDLWIEDEVMNLAHNLMGLGILAKLESALRNCGYGLIRKVSQLGFETIADLKLCGTGKTLRTEGKILREFQPTILTVSCSSGVVAMDALKSELPNTKVLGFSIPTSWTDEEAISVYGATVEGVLVRHAHLIKHIGLDGMVAPAKYVPKLKRILGKDAFFLVPAIRMNGKFPGHNPEHEVTPTEALRLDADVIVVGDPIVRQKPIDRRAVTNEIINELIVATRMNQIRA